MAASTRLLTALVLLAGALGGLEAARPTWMDELLFGRQVSASGLTLLEPPGRAQQVVAERLDGKTRVLARFLHGEITLFEAAARFGRLNATPADLPHRGLEKFKGRCEGEKLCRQVISWAEMELRQKSPPSEVDHRLRAWEAELDDHVARHGRALLPELVGAD